jgi:hypothetical protein
LQLHQGIFSSDKNKGSEPAELADIVPTVRPQPPVVTDVGDGEGKTCGCACARRSTATASTPSTTKATLRAIDSAHRQDALVDAAVEMKSERDWRNAWLRKNQEAGLTSPPGVGTSGWWWSAAATARSSPSTRPPARRSGRPR